MRYRTRDGMSYAQTPPPPTMLATCVDGVADEGVLGGLHAHDAGVGRPGVHPDAHADARPVRRQQRVRHPQHVLGRVCACFWAGTDTQIRNWVARSVVYMHVHLGGGWGCWGEGCTRTLALDFAPLLIGSPGRTLARAARMSDSESSLMCTASGNILIIKEGQ